MKFETSQFQRNNQKPANSLSIFASDSLRKDKAGRSLLGQQYVWALVNWLADYPRLNLKKQFDNETYMNVSVWLGNKSPHKVRLVRMIVAKLTHDWKSLKRLSQGSVNKRLAYFSNTVDIWQYTFPKSLNTLLQDIGKMESKINDPQEKCDPDKEEETNIENEFSIILNLISLGPDNMSGFADKNDLIKIWLISSITKTLKDQTGLTELFSGFNQNT